MTTDLVSYASQHRYRLRNLHDGLPCPPARQRRPKGRRAAFAGREDRDLAVVCQLGYICAEGDGIGWVLLCPSKRGLGHRLTRLRRLPGVAVRQEADTEAAGTATIAALPGVLRVLRPYRRRSAPRGASANVMRVVRACRA